MEQQVHVLRCEKAGPSQQGHRAGVRLALLVPRGELHAHGLFCKQKFTSQPEHPAGSPPALLPPDRERTCE